MTEPPAMPSVRRRPIPGTTRRGQDSPSSPPPPAETSMADVAAPVDLDAIDGGETIEQAGHSENGTEASESRADLAAGESEHTGRVRWPAADYAATRLTNFRIPVDLHDRYRRLVHEAELRHPRVRRPSLTEVVIALLEEGPSTPDEVAELIRRKRAAEHGPDG
jgi:hypothetical protein